MGPYGDEWFSKRIRNNAQVTCKLRLQENVDNRNSGASSQCIYYTIEEILFVDFSCRFFFWCSRADTTRQNISLLTPFFLSVRTFRVQIYV